MATGLRFPITTDNRATKELKSVGRTAGLVAAGIVTAFAGVGVAVGKVLYDIGREADNMRSEIVKGTGASGAALDGLMDTALAVSGQIVQGMEGAGAAVATLNTHFGATGKELEDIASRTADFARVTDAEIGSVADNLGQVSSIWGLTADQASSSLDVFTGVVQGFNIEGSALLTMMQRYGPVFANAGFGIEATAMLFGELHAAGVDVTRIGPGINKFLRDVAAEGGNAQAELTDTVAEIKNAASDMAALDIATKAFGAEGAQRLTTAIRAGGVAFSFAADDIAGYSGALEQAAEDSLTLGDKFTLLKNEVTAAFAPVALELLTDVADWVAGIVEDVKGSDAAQKIKKAIEEGDWLGAAGEALKLAWDVIWDGDVDGIIPDVDDKIAALKAAVEAEGPKVWAGLNYLEGFQGSEAQLALARAWQAFTADPVNAFASVQSKFVEHEQWIRDNAPKLAEALDEFTNGDWSREWDEWLKVVEDAQGVDDKPGGLKGALRDLRDAVTEDMPLIAGAVNLFAGGDDWKMPWRRFAGQMAISFTEGGQLAFNTMISALNAGLEGLLTIAVNQANGLIAILNGAIRGINAVSPFADIPSIPSIDRDTLSMPDIPQLDILGGLHDAINAWINYDIGGIRAGEIENRMTAAAASDLLGGTDNARALDAARQFAGTSPSSQSPDLVPRYAEGGIVTRPTLALIGEEGPEAVVPLDRGGGMGTTIIVQGFVGNERQLAAELNRILDEGARVTGRGGRVAA